MAITLKRVDKKKEMRDLFDSEKLLFLKSDRATDSSYWDDARAFWIMDGERNIGRIDVCHNMRFQDGEEKWKYRGWLYVQSFGLIRSVRGNHGFRIYGSGVVDWLVGYANKEGFDGISTNERAEWSASLIELYRNFDFKEVRRMDRYFTQPSEPCVVLEREL